MLHRWLIGFLILGANAALTDWVSDDNMPGPCKGRYEPAVNDPEMPTDGSIRVTADESELTKNGDSLLRGRVVVNQDNVTLKANEARLVRDEDGHVHQIRANGHVVFNTPEVMVAANIGESLLDEKVNRLSETEYRYYPWNARGEARHLTLDENSHVILHHASYTTCPPGSNLWQLKARKVVLNPDTGRGQAQKATLYVGKVPVFYSPYFDFPIDDRRQSGFLYPDFANVGKSGLVWAQPYYWNMAENYDSTITPRLFTKRGLEMKINFRYMTEQSNGELFASWLPNDREYGRFRASSLQNNTLDPLDPRTRSLKHGNHRSAFHWEHSYQYNDYLNLSWTFTDVADDNHFIDLGNNIDASSDTQLEKAAKLSYLSNHWQSQLRYQEYKVLHPFLGPKNSEPYRRHPEWTFSGYYPYVLPMLTTGVSGQFVNYSHKPDPFDQREFTRGHRYHARPMVALPLRIGALDVTPRAQFDVTHYNLALGNTELTRGDASDFTRTVPIYDVDMRMNFTRGESTIFELSPHFYYLNVPYREQNRLPNFDTGFHTFSAQELYRDNRFSGRDRIGDEDRLTLGAHFDVIQKGQTRFSATLARARLFTPHKVFLCTTDNASACEQLEDTFGGYAWSPWALNAYAPVNKDTKVYSELLWHPESKFNRSMVMLQYHPGKWVFNTGYHFEKKDTAETDFTALTTRRLHQVSASTIVPIAHDWRAFVHTRYDIEHHHMSDLVGGIEYDTCCAAIKLYASRFIEGDEDVPNTYKSGIFLSVNFKGLSELSYSGESRALDELIPGYATRH